MCNGVAYGPVLDRLQTSLPPQLILLTLELFLPRIQLLLLEIQLLFPAFGAQATPGATLQCSTMVSCAPC